jgi:hypothetical protein
MSMACKTPSAKRLARHAVPDMKRLAAHFTTTARTVGMIHETGIPVEPFLQTSNGPEFRHYRLQLIISA